MNAPAPIFLPRRETAGSRQARLPDRRAAGGSPASPGARACRSSASCPKRFATPSPSARRCTSALGRFIAFTLAATGTFSWSDPRPMNSCCSTGTGNFSAFGGWQPVFGRHFDGGLLLRDGEDHQWHRKLVATAFKQDQLQSYLAAFRSNIAELLPGRQSRSKPMNSRRA